MVIIPRKYGFCFGFDFGSQLIVLRHYSELRDKVLFQLCSADSAVLDQTQASYMKDECSTRPHPI